jgi:hypothetical protein
MMMEIWNVEKIDTALNRVLTFVPKTTGTESFFDELTQKILLHNPINEDEFAVLYFASIYIYNSKAGGPDIVVKQQDGAKRSHALDELAGMFQENQEYKECVEKLQISLMLTKPNGREFCERSPKFSEGEYEEFRQVIYNELVSLRDTATKYIRGVSEINVLIK